MKELYYEWSELIAMGEIDESFEDWLASRVDAIASRREK